MIKECKKYNIEPIVTMYHFDLPWYLETKGGWGNRETIDRFESYCNVLFNEYGKDIKYWLTINEQNTMILLQGQLGYQLINLFQQKRALSNESSYDACTSKGYETLS